MTSDLKFEFLKQEFQFENSKFYFNDLKQLDKNKFGTLPYSLRIILESLIRNYNHVHTTGSHIEFLLNWKENIGKDVPFYPARVLLQDFSSVPALVDLAAIRNEIKCNSHQMNPTCPIDLVLDHVLADGAKKIVIPKGSNGSDLCIEVGYIECPIHNLRTECAELVERNRSLEFNRCKERLSLLKWSSKSFENILCVPPFNQISHQTNVESLARVLFNEKQFIYPDSLIGTDSHSCLSNALGILSFETCALQSENVILGNPYSFTISRVIGFTVKGSLGDEINSIDVVLAITKHLRSINLKNTIVEFNGESMHELSISERETLCNMCADYGALISYFPMDTNTLDYLRQTGRSNFNLNCIEEYFKRAGFAYNQQEIIDYSEIIEFDLSTVRAFCSGPKKASDKFELENLSTHFKNSFSLSDIDLRRKVNFNDEIEVSHGSVLVASISSYTNSSNPSVMLTAALLAKKAYDLGIQTRSYIKKTFFPGSGLLTKNYLIKSGLLHYIELLGFNVVGYGCSTCIENESDLQRGLIDLVNKNELICAGVLSGNKNFENRVSTAVTKANFLVSPALVVAYAIAGTVNINFEHEPIYTTKDNRKIFLKDIWPTREEISSIELNIITPEIYKNIEKNLWQGNEDWHSILVTKSHLYQWDLSSTYIRKPPFLDSISKEEAKIEPILNAHVLLFLEDSVTSDQISPAGSIARTSSAAKYLIQNKVQPRDFNSYGSRRGNHEIMSRGTFSSNRLVNRLVKQQGTGKTVYLPNELEMDIYDAARQYKLDGVPIILLAGKDYGCGASRDWSLKGQWMLGIRAIIAESFDKNHKTNLLSIGILPLQFKLNESAKTLGLTGKEQYSILVDDNLSLRMQVDVLVNSNFKFQTEACIDTPSELLFYRHSGLLNYFTRKYL